MGYAERISRAFGFIDVTEVDAITKYARLVCESVESPVFVNIGAGPGTSGLAMREGCAKAEIYTIDISVDSPFGGLMGERHAFSDAGLQCPIQVLRDSKVYGYEFKKPIDLLMIDGDHSLDGVTGDIIAWMPNMKDGGYVLFHDYHNAVANIIEVEMSVDAFVASPSQYASCISKVEKLETVRILYIVRVRRVPDPAKEGDENVKKKRGKAG